MRGSQAPMRSRSSRVTSTGESSARAYPLASCAAVRFETPAIARIYTRAGPMLRTIAVVLILCGAGLAQAAEEIRLWHGMAGAAGAELDRLVARYNASQKDYRVVSYFQGPYDEVMANDIELRKGTRRSPHIVQVQDAGTADMMRSGLARPLWQLVAESAAEAAAEVASKTATRRRSEIPARGCSLLFRRRGPAAGPAVHRCDAGALLQPRRIPPGRVGSRAAAENLVRGREDARRAGRNPDRAAA
jgi:hypothetical protein